MDTPDRSLEKFIRTFPEVDVLDIRGLTVYLEGAILPTQLVAIKDEIVFFYRYDYPTDLQNNSKEEWDKNLIISYVNNALVNRTLHKETGLPAKPDVVDSIDPESLDRLLRNGEVPFLILTTTDRSEVT